MFLICVFPQQQIDLVVNESIVVVDSVTYNIKGELKCMCSYGSYVSVTNINE